MKKIFIPIIFLCVSINIIAQNIDARLLDAINPPDDRPIDGFMKSVSNTSFVGIIGVPVTIGVAGLACNDKVMIRNACVIGAASAINAGVTMVMKYSFNRTRPYKTYSFIHNKAVENSPSFPSGHTSTAFATATSFSLAYPKWYVIAPSYLWAGTVAYSRMHLGVHYPTDVLVGILVGVGSSYLAYKGNIWLTKKYPNFGK